tara:strand:+ start:333 stop:818 length:486 start_codon:yes stop_codon:yes gene_type:complete
MPSCISHAIIGYLLFGKKGAIYGALPDLIGFVPYFTRIGLNIKGLSFQKILNWGDIFPQSKMKKHDWFLYNISHSLITWFIVYSITKDKAVYSAIFAIVMDIFLHNDKIWSGPSFMYPLNEYRYNGLHWLSPIGIMITLSIILLLLLIPKETIQEYIQLLP